MTELPLKTPSKKLINQHGKVLDDFDILVMRVGVESHILDVYKQDPKLLGYSVESSDGHPMFGLVPDIRTCVPPVLIAHQWRMFNPVHPK